MSSLTETAYYTRRAINWGILGMIAYLILRVIWSIFVAFVIYLFPPQPPPPNHAFGVLPAIKFPDKNPDAPALTYKLETIEGGVPQASSSAAVFFMPKINSNFLSLPKTQNFAEKLQFLPQEHKVAGSQVEYVFNDNQYPLRKLKYNIMTNNFELNYSYNVDQSVFGSPIPLINSAIKETYNLLLSNDIAPSDTAQTLNNIQYLKLVGDKLLPTISVAEANAVKINFLRKPIGGIGIYYPHPQEGVISFITTGDQEFKKRIIQIKYNYNVIDYTRFATYKLKTGADAWQELQSGGGYIAGYPAQGQQATVRHVKLGYYESLGGQLYLQPIFVFEGDDGFIAYVPAIAKEWSE